MLPINMAWDLLVLMANRSFGSWSGNTYLMLKRRDRDDRRAPRVTPAVRRRRVEPCRKLKAVWLLAAFNSGVARSVPRAARREVADRQTDVYPAIPAIPEFKSISS